MEAVKAPAIPQLKGKCYYLPSFNQAYDFVTDCRNAGYFAEWTPAGCNYFCRVWKKGVAA